MRQAPPQASPLRRVVLMLAAGAGVQRIAALVGSVVLARALGVARFGELMTGLQIAVIFGMLADAGMLPVAARQAAAEPERAGGWVRAAMRARCLVAIGLVALLAAASPWIDADPWFLLLCGSSAIAASVDLKGLAEATGRTGIEVRIDSATALGYLAVLGALAFAGVTDLRLYAGAALLARLGYACASVPCALAIPSRGPEPSVRALMRGAGLVSFAQACHGLVLASDLLLLRCLATPDAVGWFAVARRVAQAAEAPAALLSRAVQPHLDHAAAHGDPAGTLRRALAIAAHASLPIAVGGWLLAEPLLVRLFGEDYGTAAWTLRWLLLCAGVVAIGSRFGITLLALARDRAYSLPLFLGATTNLTTSLVLIPTHGAAGSAFATLAGLLVTVTTSAVALRHLVPLALLAALQRPLLVTAAVALATTLVPASVDPLLAVLAGAVAFVFAFATLERSSLRSFGGGLHQASGFRGAADVAGERP